MDARNTFRPPPHFTFLNFLMGVRLRNVGLRGISLQDFRREAPEIGAEGAILENVCNFLEILFLKNAIKSESLGTWG